MTHKDDIQHEIDKTLQCIDGIKRAEANPFLFTRIKARMDKKSNGWEGVFSFISKPAIAFAILVLVMAVNGWALLTSGSGENQPADTANAYTSELATEYNTVASVNNYDYENMTNE